MTCFINTHGYNFVIKWFCPFLRKSGSTINNTQKRAKSCAGTVCIFTTVIGDNKTLSEITFSVEKTKYYKGNVFWCIKARLSNLHSLIVFLWNLTQLVFLDTKGSRRSIVHNFSCFQIINAIMIAFYCFTDCSCNSAVLRNIGKSDINQFLTVTFCKRSTLKRSCENFTIHSLVCMIDNCILKCISGCNFRMSRCQTRPKFRTDPAAITVLISIVHITTHRRNNSGFQICFSGSVLNPVWDHIGKPVIAKNGGIHVSSIALHSCQPYDLKIQIIICRWSHGKILDIEIHIRNHSLTLKRCTKNTAYIFSCPASSQFVTELV